MEVAMGKMGKLFIELSRDMSQDDLQAGGVTNAYNIMMGKILKRKSRCHKAPLNLRDIRHLTCSVCGRVSKFNWMNQDIFKK